MTLAIVLPGCSTLTTSSESGRPAPFSEGGGVSEWLGELLCSWAALELRGCALETDLSARTVPPPLPAPPQQLPPLLLPPPPPLLPPLLLPHKWVLNCDEAIVYAPPAPLQVPEQAPRVHRRMVRQAVQALRL